MESLLLKISQLYELCNLTILERVSKGFLSENYILTDSTKKYFLKKYRFDNEKRIREIHSVKKYFADGGIPIILPILTHDGASFFANDGNYHALFPFVYGRQLEKNIHTKQSIAALGKTLGLIHLRGKKSDLKIDDFFKAWNKEDSLNKITVIEKKIQETNLATDFDKLAWQTITLKKRFVELNARTYDSYINFNDHLLHGDYVDHNVFFNDDDEIIHVFDFEKTGYGPRSYELFRSMIYTLFREKINEETIERAKIYLDSYLNAYPMSQEERASGIQIFYLKSIHSLWIESEHYLKNNTRIDCFLQEDFQRITYLSKNIDGLIKILSIFPTSNSIAPLQVRGLR